MDPTDSELVECPACGGAGGGPFGRAGSAWDDEEYVCPRCEGRGAISVVEVDVKPVPRPGIVKTTPAEIREPAKKKQA